MTTSALITMIGSWLVITFFTFRFFLKVLKTPQEKE
jgi:hypothetical protein